MAASIAVTSGEADEVIDLSGNVHADITENENNYGAVTVNLAANSQWVGSFGASPWGQGGMTVNGPGLFLNTGESWVDNHVLIAADVRGCGGFAVYAAHAGAVLEFGGLVGAGQSVSIAGLNEYGNQHGVVQVDQPDEFHAAVTLGFGELNLMGLSADSYAIKGNALLLFQGNQVIDRVRLAMGTYAPGIGAPVDFGVTQTASGVSVHADAALVAGNALPIHVA